MKYNKIDFYFVQKWEYSLLNLLILIGLSNEFKLELNIHPEYTFIKEKNPQVNFSFLNYFNCNYPFTEKNDSIIPLDSINNINDDLYSYINGINRNSENKFSINTNIIKKLEDIEKIFLKYITPGKDFNTIKEYYDKINKEYNIEKRKGIYFVSDLNRINPDILKIRNYIKNNTNEKYLIIFENEKDLILYNKITKDIKENIDIYYFTNLEKLEDINRETIKEKLITQLQNYYLLSKTSEVLFFNNFYYFKFIDLLKLI